MKKIEHQFFLKNNKLDKKLLLQPIQEKIEIFDRMHKLLETVSDCEKGNLLEQLEELDLEILEDIDEEYADKLEFNEIEEVLEEKPVLEKVITQKRELEKVIIKPEIPKKITDESILDELVKMGRTQDIGRSTFRDLGIKTQLGWETSIGKYRVVRTSVFRYRYEVERI
jgi:regulator of replication initiation timing